MASVTIELNLAAVNELSTLEAGAAVHAELHRLHHRVELDQRQRPKVTPRLTAEHPLRDWLWELGEYARARCSRCSAATPTTGLLQAYWGAWLCRGCADELGRVRGELDRNGWPGRVAA